tara:strand:- start:2297 stop:8848 length:6552 start_codon:yes stop_codon:yes gene_type:complete
MPKSKFLPYQDINNDGLNDACPELDITPEPFVCLDCSPNPNALVPDWTKRKKTEAFLNEKTCKYQVTIRADETTTGAESADTPEQAAEALNKIWAKYAEEAAENILVAFDKDSSEKSINKLVAGPPAIEYTKYDLDPRPNSHLKLLYSVPFELLNEIEAASPESEDEAAEDDEDDDILIEYSAAELVPNMIRIRQGFDMYAKYSRVYRQIERGNIKFVDSGGILNIEEYGDNGLWVDSVMGALIQQLDQWLNQKGFNLAGTGEIPYFNWNQSVTKLRFRFSKDYELKRLLVWTSICPEKASIYGKSDLRGLRAQSAWKDPIAVAYFTQIVEMLRDLEARTPMHWIDFLIKHTRPEVRSTISEADKNPGNTIESCIHEALENEMKELGQDIMDDIFSLGDSIAYMYHNNLCARSLEERQGQLKRFGQTPNIGGQDMDDTSIGALASYQAFKQLETEDAVAAELCAKLLASVSGGLFGSADDMIEDLWEDYFNKIGLCGLYELLLDSIKCLFSGLSLETALSKVCESALRSMGVENFGDLFVGLPPEKQAELDALVKQKLADDEFFKEGTPGQKLSDAIDGKTYQHNLHPWEKPDPALSREEQWEGGGYTTGGESEGQNVGGGAQAIAGGRAGANARTTNIDNQRLSHMDEDRNRTLAQKFDVGGNTASKGQLNPAVVMDAYILALIEVYSENLFELVDFLNRFPGARLVAFVLATFDCPRPPTFDFLDWMHDNLELPFCNTPEPITGPYFHNPRGWLNTITDLLKWIWDKFLWAIEWAIRIIMFHLLKKICELLGDALCAAAGVVGNMAASLPSVIQAGGTSDAWKSAFSDAVRDAVCGPDASQDQIDNTIEDLFNSLGSNGQEFGNRQKVLTFAEDLSASVTANELKEAFLGRPSDTFTKVVESLLDFEHPELRRGIPNARAVNKFFKNVGNLFPAEFKQQLEDSLDSYSNEEMPANPSLCASPRDIDNFKNLRCQLLEGRATQEQCDAMYDQYRGRLEDALADASRALEKGPAGIMEDMIPPLISAPGCSNGLIPFESDEAIADISGDLENEMDQLKIDFSEDMIGNGGLFGGDSDWGMINMVLSDTKGNPLTNHHRSVYNKSDYVNFYNNWDPPTGDDVNFWVTPRITPIFNQEGAYPTKVAGWLQQCLNGSVGDVPLINPDYGFSNVARRSRRTSATFAHLNIADGFFTDLGTQLMGLPDRGYNVETKVNMWDETVEFIRAARKDSPDLQMQFRDNARGMRDKGQSEYSYGFNLNLYLSDIVETVDGDGNPNRIYANRPDDNARIYITNIFNDKAKVSQNMAQYEKLDEDGASKTADSNSDLSINKDRYMEFLTVDDSLENVDLEKYPKLMDSFATKKDYIPQIAAFSDLTGIAIGSLTGLHDTIMKSSLEQIAKEVAANENAFSYGAQFDTLAPADLEYVVDRDQTESTGGTPYGDALILDDEGGTRSIENDDMILGISRMEYNEKYHGGTTNRVTYLDPAIFGGTYNNPGVYVKPFQNIGWLGFVDVLFPELSPCKPTRTDLVDFGEIQNRVASAYPSISEDERLQQDPECVVELPYNRVLHRAAVAGIDGLIAAACRIYASSHFIKAMATFTTFSPDFDNVYSDIFAQYIVENMEKRFKEANSTGPGWEWLTSFKDSEFWYAFLEQAVQNYARRVDIGEIPNPPAHIIRVLSGLTDFAMEAELFTDMDTSSLNDMQEQYAEDYPFREDLDEAKARGEVSWWEGLENYRMEQNLIAIKQTEEKAKLVLKEAVKEELRYMGEKFIKNLQSVGMTPKYFDLDWYLLQHMTQGQSLDLDKEIKEEAVDLPTTGDGHYTHGDEFSNTDDNTEYVGYYHVHIDEDGDTIYMAGEEHSLSPHPVLRPLAKQMAVPIGDIDGYLTKDYTWDPTRPFIVEKYIRINDDIGDPSRALETIKSKPGADNISDHYPGTMELLVDPDNSKVVGIQGELGVRYGLRFSFYDGVIKSTITTVEVDALDTTIANIAPLDADSKLLYCLIKMLKEDEKFRLLSRYVFPLNKLVSMVAIYNDMGFLPSIGEITVQTNQSKGIGTEAGTKPGMAADVTVNDDGTLNIDYADSRDGWQSNRDRNSDDSWFVLEFDKWDKILLRNSTARIKKLFKGYYTSRKFEIPEDLTNAGSIWINGAKAAIKGLTQYKAFLPWYRRDRLRTNPYDANGELCKKED